MALKDILKGPSEEEIKMKLKKLNPPELEEVFTSTFRELDRYAMYLIFKHTEIKEEKKFLNSFSAEIEKMRSVISLIEKYTKE